MGSNRIVGAFKKFAMIAGVVAVASAGAGAADEVATAKDQLQRQLVLLEQIERHVEQDDRGRILVIKNSITKVSESIEKNGLAHSTTFRAYQSLIVTFRYSGEFFTRIQGEMNQTDIDELLKISEKIVEARGFDDSPYTQLTASIYGQMKKLVDDLQGLAIPDELRAKLNRLIEPIGGLLAIAAQGDRPKTFAAGNRVYELVAAIYPEFNEVSISNPAFEMVINIQGLNEFYAEFAQIH